MRFILATSYDGFGEFLLFCSSWPVASIFAFIALLLAFRHRDQASLRWAVASMAVSGVVILALVLGFTRSLKQGKEMDWLVLLIGLAPLILAIAVFCFVRHSRGKELQ